MAFVLPWTVNKLVSTNINNANSITGGAYGNVSLKVGGKTQLVGGLVAEGETLITGNMTASNPVTFDSSGCTIRSSWQTGGASSMGLYRNISETLTPLRYKQTNKYFSINDEINGELWNIDLSGMVMTSALDLNNFYYRVDIGRDLNVPMGTSTLRDLVVTETTTLTDVLVNGTITLSDVVTGNLTVPVGKTLTLLGDISANNLAVTPEQLSILNQVAGGQLPASAVSGIVGFYVDVDNNQLIEGVKTFVDAPVMSGSSITAGTIGQTQVSNGYVALSGNQTVGGTKTFSSPPIMSGASITGGTIQGSSIASGTITEVEIENGYIDNFTNQLVQGIKTFQSPPVMSGASITTASIPQSAIAGGGAFVDLTTNQTVGGIKTFSSPPVMSGASITTASIPQSAIAGGGAFVDLTSNQTITGIKTYSSVGGITTTSSPIINSQYLNSTIFSSASSLTITTPIYPVYCLLPTSNMTITLPTPSATLNGAIIHFYRTGGTSSVLVNSASNNILDAVLTYSNVILKAKELYKPIICMYSGGAYNWYYLVNNQSPLLQSNNIWEGSNSFDVSLPQSILAPVFSNDLVNKEYHDSIFTTSNTYSGNNTLSGTTTFTGDIFTGETYTDNIYLSGADSTISSKWATGPAFKVISNILTPLDYDTDLKLFTFNDETTGTYLQLDTALNRMISDFNKNIFSNNVEIEGTLRVDQGQTALADTICMTGNMDFPEPLSLATTISLGLNTLAVCNPLAYGDDITAIGSGVLQVASNIHTGTTCIGRQCFGQATNLGNNNVAIGYRAGYNITSGSVSNCTFIGANTGVLTPGNTYNNSMALGNGAIISNSNNVVLGGSGLLVIVPSNLQIQSKFVERASGTVRSAAFSLPTVGFTYYSIDSVVPFAITLNTASSGYLGMRVTFRRVSGNPLNAITSASNNVYPLTSNTAGNVLLPANVYSITICCLQETASTAAWYQIA
jgi:hypothetical protein